MREREKVGSEKTVLCHACGQHLPAKYTLVLNKALAEILVKIYKIKAPVRTAVVAGDTRYQYSNCSKLRLWGLIAPYQKTPVQKAMRGWWVMTKKGVDFVEGRVAVPEKLLQTGSMIEFTPCRDVHIWEVEASLKIYADWAAEARASGPQLNLSHMPYPAK